MVSRAGDKSGRRLPDSKSIDAYLAAQTTEARTLLERLRGQIRSAAPEAEETISYRMPAFRYHGRALVGFAAFKEHCSFFPMSAALMDARDAELRGFRTSKGTIRFTASRPLPASLVRKLVRARMREIDARG